MKFAIKILIAIILFQAFGIKQAKSQFDNYEYYIGAGVAYGGYMLYKHIKKNSNPEARKFKKSVKSIEEQLNDNENFVFENKNTIITSINDTENLFEKAKDKSLKFHKDFEEYRNRFFKSHDKFNSVLFNLSEKKLNEYKLGFEKSINENDLITAEIYADSIKRLYHNISWTKENTPISNINAEYDEKREIISEIKQYQSILSKMQVIGKNTPVEKIATLYISLKTSEKNLKSKNIESIIDKNRPVREEISNKISENYYHFSEKIEGTTEKQEIKNNITTLQIYKSILTEVSIDENIRKQKMIYNQQIEKEINQNLATLRRTTQTYSNIEIYNNLTSKNNNLKQSLFLDVADDSGLKKITDENEKYVMVETRIKEKQREKERKQQEWYDRNYYNGHRIHIGPRTADTTSMIMETKHI